MVDWGDIHKDFLDGYQSFWKDHGFGYQQTKEWKEALRENFAVNDFAFCIWLRDEKHLTAQALQQQGNAEDLKAEYSKLWTETHEDFAKKEHFWSKTNQQLWGEWDLTYQDAREWIPAGFEPGDYFEINQWKKRNFVPQEAKSWIDIGLTKYDHEFAAYLRWKDFQPNSNLNLKQLKEEFATWKKQLPAQEYLDCFYPKNQRNKIKELDIREKNLTGNLDLSDFINLEVLNCSKNQLTSLSLNNCLKLKKITCSKNNLKQDLSLFSYLINLDELWASDSFFAGSLEFLKNLNKLKLLDIRNTDIDSGLEYLPDSLKEFYCSADQQKDAKCQTIFNLFSNEQGTIETEYGSIKNFPQKLQAYKQKLYIKPQIEKELISNNLTSEQLTQQLISDKHIANPGHTWQDYLNYAQSPEELKARKDKIFASVENLKAEKQNQEELRKAEEKRILTSLISTDRLYTIRRGMDRFLDRWRKGLPNLQWVERFEYAISTVQWANRGVLIASGVQLIRGDSSMSNWTTLISPFVEVFISNLVERYESNKLKQSLFAEDAENIWDSYNDLKAMLDPIEISLLSEGKVKTTLEELGDKVHGFWKQHDINKDGEIDDEEWKVAKENFSQDLRNNWAVRKTELMEIKEIAEKLRKEISDYHKNEARNLGGKQKENTNKIIPIQPEEVVIDLEETTNQSLNSSQINLLNKAQKEAIEMQKFEAQIIQKEPLGVPGSSKK